MENCNYDIACNVKTCAHNYQGCNCKLNQITVGCSCGSDKCTCCESYSQKI